MTEKIGCSDAKVTKRNIVYAYGFDAAGFPAHRDDAVLDDIARVEFVNLYSTMHLSCADGVIIPQGIFERIERQSAPFGQKSIVSVDKFMMLERERQIFDLLRSGKWACFLVGNIVDEVSQGLHLEPITDTDLCKRMLNSFMVGRRHRYNFYIDNPPDVVVRKPEFDDYMRRFGAPTTVFNLPHRHPIERAVIAELGGHPVGFEFDAQLFFLPYRPIERNWPTEMATLKAVTKAIIRYRRKRVTEIPAWLNALKFEREETLYCEINSLLEKVNRLESELRSWQDYKTILCTADANLRSKIITILRSVFELDVNESASLRIATVSDRAQCSTVLIEMLSTVDSVDKHTLDQIDRRRTAAGLTKSTPTVLFVNSDMTVENIHKRERAGVPQETVDYAKNLNVLIVRTIDLLFLMRRLEDEEERGTILLRLLRSQRGWLKVEPEELRCYF